MNVERQVRGLFSLIQDIYPDWTGFDHPEFVAQEVKGKRALLAEAQTLINQAEVDQLIAQGAFAELLTRWQQLSKRTRLLWRGAPTVRDTAVLFHSQLDMASFTLQMRNLLFADRPTPERLQTFADYLEAHQLPSKWPLATYFLLICQPTQEMFVKPRVMSWFLKFMGEQTAVTNPPTAAVYTSIMTQVTVLYPALQAYGAQDMVDVQSLIWACAQASKDRIGRLDAKGQVELDVPPTPPLQPTTYQITSTPKTLKETSASDQPAYSLSDWATETGYAESELARWVRAVERKGQAILYGPPGTGKTFMAERLAQHLVGGSDGLVQLVQFHPAYAYEDFVQGIRPSTDALGGLHYELRPGRFYQFCQEARQRNGRCAFIIDEFNRAHVATVFGELMYLLEYRDRVVPLAGGGTFCIPTNVYVIGTMNTADRSIALVDHALRRRFAFIHLPPNEVVLRHYHRQTGFAVEGLLAILRRLNNQIDDPHYHLGTSFFMQPNLADHLADIWRMEIEPYLEEYFFDRPDRVEAFRWPQVKADLLS